ncbi:cytochrome P450 [Kitasatospora sp. SUK 42]|uniref:cytochrome P450 n=1 Tax=Kitasatospora sp. SUK 42 TaxID=1588882 RepID=UPI0018CBC40E|nr:cytochrome P450 [Kitasatospora sp. SUK 42]MBV2155313.1 cytochrome P450 [Kitasatospora sp. SUK 42]
MTSTRVPVPFEFTAIKGLGIDHSYRELLEHGRPVWVTPPYGENAWLVSRYADIKAILGDQRFGRAAAADRDEARVAPVPVGGSIMGADAPDHGRLRRLISKPFSNRGVERLRPGIVRVAEELLDAMAEQGSPVDLVTAFTGPFSALNICELLGVPEGERDRFQGMVQCFFGRTELSPEEIAVELELLRDYVRGLLDLRRREPGDDLVSAMLEAAAEGGAYTDEELLELVYTLLVGGYDTPASQLASTFYVLLSQPDQAQLLREHPEAVPQAVEELLRFVPLVSHTTFARYPTEDVEIGGQLIRAGEPVLCATPAGNMDPRAFEDPEVLELRRAGNAHLSFGHGLHHCTGAALARVEMQVAITALLTRFPDLRLDVAPEDVQWLKGMQIRTLGSLPVAWGPGGSRP